MGGGGKEDEGWERNREKRVGVRLYGKVINIKCVEYKVLKAITAKVIQKAYQL